MANRNCRALVVRQGLVDWTFARVDDLVVFEKRGSDIITPTSFTSRPLDCAPITSVGDATWPSCLIPGCIIDSLSIPLDIYFLSSGQSRAGNYRFTGFTWIRNSVPLNFILRPLQDQDRWIFVRLKFLNR